MNVTLSETETAVLRRIVAEKGVAALIRFAASTLATGSIRESETRHKLDLLALEMVESMLQSREEVGP